MTSLAGEASERRRRVFGRRHALDAAIVLLLVATEIEIWTNPIDDQLVLTLLAPPMTLPLVFRRRLPLLAPIVPALVVGVASFFAAQSIRQLAVPVATAALGPYLLGRYNDRTRALVGLGIGFVCIQIFSVEVEPGGAAGAFVSVVSVGPWLVGQALRGREHQALELRERSAELEREREQRDRAARAAERLRIPRELHDVIAHSIGVMTIQAGAARLALEAEPGRSVEALRSVAGTGRQTLAEMRRLLGAVESDAAEGPTLSNLGPLVEHYRSAGLPVEVDVDGPPKPLGAGLDLAAYRIVQEALTNSLKYAGPATARVVLRYTREALDLEIADDGDGSGAGTGSGHGLVGMRERAAIYGGRLEAGPRSTGGFAVRARLPLEESVS